MFIRLPPGCGELSGKVVKLGRSLYGWRQSSRTWHNHLVHGLKCLGFESCAADACVMRLIEHSVVAMVVVVRVDDIIFIGLNSRCDTFGVDLRWYAGCRFSRDAVLGTVAISQQAVAEKLDAKFVGLCIDTDIRRYIDRYDIIYLSAERFCRYLDIYRRRYMRYIGVFPHC